MLNFVGKLFREFKYKDFSKEVSILDITGKLMFVCNVGYFGGSFSTHIDLCDKK